MKSLRGVRGVLGGAALAAVLAMSPSAHAFCGFYVAGGDQQMFADATQVVLMRMGTRTVLAMQNNYKGPPGEFAMVIPVPVVLQEGDVKTLGPEVFDHVEKMGAPRLVEYWEEDPCQQTRYEESARMPRSAAPMGMADTKTMDKDDLGVKVEAQFVVGEYQIVILSAKEATGLDTWLRQQKYNIPAGAEPLLRPYVESGMKFFVAKVDPAKVKWVGTGNDKRAELSPLRFHYDTDEFSLPIRLGLANSSGKQDLIVNILAPNQRYEVSNYKNVTIPTNIDVAESVKDKFGAFYTALYDRTVEKNPGAVVTEYAWQATTCDPCPGPALNYQEFQTLGADVLTGARDKPTPYNNADFVLTRLHARYGKEISDDLRFKEAGGIVGGREFLKRVDNGNPITKLVNNVRPQLEEGAQSSPTNNFQGRYAVRHEWTGPIKCDNPQRFRWGGPPREVASQPGFVPTGVKPATDLAFAPRGAVALPDVVERDVPEIDLKSAVITTIAAPVGGIDPKTPVATPEGSAKPTSAPSTTPAKTGGCGCQASDSTDLAGLGLGVLAVGGMLGRRRRRS
ncbi:MAG: DUF2330 domain-containing protein [Proteobacteria bacterium]|nr:DUF2330 domain-containing protein [Pseudomonadota bacterium]